MKTNWWKWGVLTAIAAAIFYGGWKCGSGNVKPGSAVTIRDTIITPGQLVIDTAYVPKPVKVVVRDTIGYSWHDTMFISPGPTNEINRVIHKAYYSDTVKVSYGSVTITDTITDNRIIGRSVNADISVPTVTKTVTLTQPKRAILYGGLNVSGGPQNYLFSLGADLSLKTKNDRIYSAGVSLTRDNQVLYGIGMKFPIRLKK